MMTHRPLIAVGVMALAVAGCATPTRTETAATSAAASVAATPPPASEAQVQTLRERAAAYWAARMAGDDRGQWELLEPRGKGRMTSQEYAAGRRGIRYLGYQVEEATINGYFATVKVRVLVQPMLPRLASTPVQAVLMDDPWVRVDGTWYRQLDESQPQKREP
jgi:hypothetical protein